MTGWDKSMRIVSGGEGGLLNKARVHFGGVI